MACHDACLYVTLISPDMYGSNQNGIKMTWS